MKRVSTIAAVVAAAALNASFAGSALAAARTLEGRIVAFQCGDNCYLTIRTVSGREESGLCLARECGPWNDKAEMPKRFVGKRVKVTLGIGKQLNGNGDVEGEMTSFEAIQFLP